METRASLVAQMVKHLPAMRETWVRSPGREDTLEKEMTTHSSTLAWKIPWMEETGRLQSMGLQDWTWLNTSLVHWFRCKYFSEICSISCIWSHRRKSCNGLRWRFKNVLKARKLTLTEKTISRFKFNLLVQFSRSVASLCDPMNCSMPGLPVHHQLPEFTQTHVHRVGDAIQPSHPLSTPSPPAPNPSQHQGLFQWVNSSHEVVKLLEFQLQHQSCQWTRRTDLF